MEKARSGHAEGEGAFRIYPRRRQINHVPAYGI